MNQLQKIQKLKGELSKKDLVIDSFLKYQNSPFAICIKTFVLKIPTKKWGSLHPQKSCYEFTYNKGQWYPCRAIWDADNNRVLIYLKNGYEHLFTTDYSKDFNIIQENFSTIIDHRNEQLIKILN